VIAPRRAARPVVAVLAIWFAAVVAVGLPAEAHFLIYGLAGSALIALATYPSRLTVVALIGGGCLLLALHPAPLGESLAVEPGLPLAYIGMAAVIYVAIRALRGPTPDGLMVGAIGIPVFILLLTPVHTLIISATPRTVDPVLHRIDVAIFGELTFAAGRLLATYPWVQIPSVWSYVALALVGSGVYALALRGRTGMVRPAELLYGWAAAGALGAIGYVLVPAVGPRFVFPEWPWQMPDASGTYAVPLLPIPRNAMPSLHATWALLICWGARECPGWGKWFLVPWLAFTLLATVGAGGHYLIDLVAALPLTLAAAWAGARLARVRLARPSLVTSPSEPAAWVPGG
jgi:hypothetical protein